MLAEPIEDPALKAEVVSVGEQAILKVAEGLVGLIESRIAEQSHDDPASAWKLMQDLTAFDTPSVRQGPVDHSHDFLAAVTSLATGGTAAAKQAQEVLSQLNDMMAGHNEIAVADHEPSKQSESSNRADGFQSQRCHTPIG